MKKLLIASTVVAGLSGIAAADITVTGFARFGNTTTETTVSGAASENSETHTRLDVTADGVTDMSNGLEAFARVRVRADSTSSGATANDDPADSGAVSAARIGVRTDDVTVAFGNITGAIDSLPGLYDGGVGLRGAGDRQLAGTNAGDSFSGGGAGANGGEIIASFGDIGVHLSRSDNSNRSAAHVSTDIAGWTVALGAQNQKSIIAADGEIEGATSIGGTALAGLLVEEDLTVLTVGGSIGDVELGMLVRETSYSNATLGDVDVNGFRLNAGYSFGDTKLTGFVAEDEVDGVSGDRSYAGIGVTHDFGPLTFVLGFATEDDTRDGANEEVEVTDFGIKFSF